MAGQMNCENASGARLPPVDALHMPACPSRIGASGATPRVLLITPPMVQINTPYAATPALTAFLRSQGIHAGQSDLSLSLALHLFSSSGVRDVIEEIGRRRATGLSWFTDRAEDYARTVGFVIGYLQNGDRRQGEVLLGMDLPRGPRFDMLDSLRGAGVDPEAVDPAGYPRLLASLYLDDLADVVRLGVDERFGLSRYADRLASAADSFTPLHRALQVPPGFLDRILDSLTLELLEQEQPHVVGITLPFPGNVYAAFRIARCVKEWNPSVRTVAGGGYVNTELRDLSDHRVFDYFDYLTYDDGELPLLRIIEHAAGGDASAFVRTRLRQGREVVLVDTPGIELRHRDRPAPCYDGLPLNRYCAVTESVNPMHRLWTEKRWMKFTLAHGCYWHRCAFCDTSLDYIARYDPADVDTVVRWICEVQQRTGETHFHFVDEAAPPALLQRLAEALIRDRIEIQWWTNVRFEPSFSPVVAELLARSGCIALSGGLECAQEHLIAAMDKGVRLPEAARAMRALAEAGILVHVYLMYGFPRQTAQETVDALEFVRQLFLNQCLRSAYWHRFALTVHSPIFAAPARFGIRAAAPAGTFARNEVPFTDGRRADHAMLGGGLSRATYNYMHGVGVDEDVRAWFDGHIPRPRLSGTCVADALRMEDVVQ